MIPKFRIWAEEYKELLPVLLIDFVNNVCFVLPEAELEGGTQVAVYGLENLEQFTGLYDKDGNEIYEGDIVKNTDFYIKSHPITGIGIVEYDTECMEFIFNQIFGDEDVFYDPEGAVWIATDLQVIGNIHENPEVLEGSR